MKTFGFCLKTKDISAKTKGFIFKTTYSVYNHVRTFY